MFLACACAAFEAGCAHGPSTTNINPQTLLEQACRPGQGLQAVNGSAWVKAKSKEASGQFPAEVSVKAPDQLKMEVTNLIGATQALITVNGSNYKILVPSKNGQSQKQYEGNGYWGGIPLKWATDLFMGKIPCPASDARSGAKLSVNEDGSLVAEVGNTTNAEKYTYKFRNWEGTPWAESLHYEKIADSKLVVDFKFDQPEDKTRSPKTWEAISSRGEVKLRWKDRTLTR